MTDGPEAGGFFSRNYRKQGTASADDIRMRRRIAAYLSEYVNDDYYDFGKRVELDLGIQILTSGYNGSYIDWDEFLCKCSIEDFLDIITLVAKIWPERIVHRDRVRVRYDLISHVEAVFRQQSVSYRIDEKGGIHPFVDSAFSSELFEIVRELSRSEFNAAREHIEAAEKCLLDYDFRGNQAVRSAFDAIENIYKLMFPRRTHLNNDGIRDDLRPLFENAFAKDEVERRATAKLIDGLKSWVEAGHNYRHAAGMPEPTAPSKEFAVTYVSHSLTYARLLIAAYTVRKSEQ